MIVMTDRLTEHFKLSEFAHRDGNDLYVWIDEAFLPFVNALEDFRVWYNRPININSGYRPEKYNIAVGGSRNSSHLRMCAVDFNLPEEFYTFTDKRKNEFLLNVRRKWSQLCTKYGYHAQCNFYDTYLHLGLSFTGRSSYLDYRTDKALKLNFKLIS